MVVPRWARNSSLVLSVLGIAVATYLTIEHYSGDTSLACPASSTINCAKVTSSSYSTFLGVPVALLGLLFFVGMTVLCVPIAWRLDRRVALLRLAGLAVGVVFVLYLVWAELFAVGAICLWCTGVHLLTLVLFAVVGLGEALREDEPVWSQHRDGHREAGRADLLSGSEP